MSTLPVDYVLLSLICAMMTIWVIYKVSQNQSDGDFDNSDDSDNDGGIPFDLDPPILDLPPGVILPQDDPHLTIEKEELIY